MTLSIGLDFIGMGAFTPTAVSSGSTWNSADKAADITLSGGDLVATAASPSGGIVRSTTSKSSGKWHVEWEAITATTIVNCGVGFANSTAAITDGTYIGADGNGFAWYVDQAYIIYNGGAVGSQEVYAQGDIIAAEFDIDNALVWFAKNSGNWNNSGTANPATGTGGVSVTTGTWFIAAKLNALNSVRLRTTSGAFSRSISSGFSAWG